MTRTQRPRPSDPAPPERQSSEQPPEPGTGQLAYVELASSELTRDVNRDLVLGRIRMMQPISRVDLARASGLQPSTVSSIVERLLLERWLRESANVKTARGRRPSLLSLNDEMVCLAADIRPSHATAALVDLNGRFLERQVMPLTGDSDRSLAILAATMQTFRERHSTCTFQGVGVSLPGRVDPDTNRLVFAPNLRWANVDIAGQLQSLLGLQVQLENAANASLLAELWFGRVDNVRNAMLITVSEGIGAAVLADGRLIGGQQGLAGEFGHIPLDPDGPLCGCGARGCWEVLASSRAAMRYFQEAAPNGPARTMIELIGLALDGDPAAGAALTRQAKAIGQGLHLVNAIMSPSLILLAGDVASFYELYREVIEAECRAGAMDGIGPRIVSLGDGEVSRLRGAAAVVLQRHDTYYRAGHIRVNGG